MPPVIAFSHANGFPAGTYRLLFEAWRSAGFRVIAIDKVGHEAAYAVSSNWPRLREQLARFVEEQAPGGAVHLVGHSLGGFLSLMVACRRPELARSVVLLDSPVIAGWRAHSVRVMKAGGLMKRLAISRIAARRRWSWPSAEAAWQHFAAKAAFARWQPEVLRDYIASGTEPDPQGAVAGSVRLAFRREIESQIYSSLPHNLGRLLQRHPPLCPVAYIGGTRSAEARQAGLMATRALVQGRMRWIEGSHLFPMEQPAQTAAAVLECLVAAEAGN